MALRTLATGMFLVDVGQLQTVIGLQTCTPPEDAFNAEAERRASAIQMLARAERRTGTAFLYRVDAIAQAR